MFGLWVEEQGGYTIIELLSSYDIELGNEFFGLMATRWVAANTAISRKGG